MMWRIAIVGGVALAVGGCASSSGVASNEDQGMQAAGESRNVPVSNQTGNSLPSGNFAYVYYPEVEAYFAPDRGRWFWVDPQDGWRFDTELPAELKGRQGSGVELKLDCEHPYDRHAAVMAAYPARGTQRESTHAGADN